MKRLLYLTYALMLCAILVGCNNSQADAQPETNNLQQSTQAPYSETIVVETSSQNSTSQTLPNGALTSEEAIAIALEKAGLEKSQVIGLWAELDYDDSVLVYEVDFSNGEYDYDCDIDANSGKVLSFDKELDD